MPASRISFVQLSYSDATKAIELVVRQIPHLAAALLEALLELGQRRADIPAQPCDRFRRRLGGRENAEPGIDIETGHARFRHGRHVRRQRTAFRRQHGDALRLPRLHIRQARGDRIEKQVDAARKQIGEGRRRTLVG